MDRARAGAWALSTKRHWSSEWLPLHGTVGFVASSSNNRVFEELRRSPRQATGPDAQLVPASGADLNGRSIAKAAGPSSQPPLSATGACARICSGRSPPAPVFVGPSSCRSSTSHRVLRSQPERRRDQAERIGPPLPTHLIHRHKRCVPAPPDLISTAGLLASLASSREPTTAPYSPQGRRTGLDRPTRTSSAGFASRGSGVRIPSAPPVIKRVSDDDRAG